MKKTANTNVSGSACIHAGRVFSMMDGLAIGALYSLSPLFSGERFRVSGRPFGTSLAFAAAAHPRPSPRC